jgi:hypothetical protein
MHHNRQVTFKLPDFQDEKRWRSIDSHCQNGARSVVLSILHWNIANTTCMRDYVQSPPRQLMIQDPKSLTSRWLLRSGWCIYPVIIGFSYKGSGFIRKGQWSGNINILPLAVEYRNATINRRTRNTEPEIEPDGSSHTCQYPWVNRCQLGFGPPRIYGMWLWMVLERNKTIFRSKPRPVNNTNHGWWRCNMTVTFYIWSLNLLNWINTSETSNCRLDHELSCDYLGGCCRNISCLCAYWGCQLLVYRCWGSCTT